MAGWSQDFFNQMQIFESWKKVNPETGGNATFADWVRGGSPNAQPGAQLSVAPTGANLKFPDRNTPINYNDPGEYNMALWWGQHGVYGPEGGYAPVGTEGKMGYEDPPGVDSNPNTKKQKDEAAAADKRIRGRAATYFAKNSEDKPNLFKRSLLGG